MADEGKVKDPMAGAPIAAPKVDEAALLSDVRSPHFITACTTLRIDPIELVPRTFDSFSESGLLHEKQQIRFAMYERGRLSKWTALNECRRVLPKLGGAQNRSMSAEPNGKKKLNMSRMSAEGSTASLGHSWIDTEMARSSMIASRGQVEVFKTTFKKLKDIQDEGRQVAREVDDTEKMKQEERAAAEQKRRMLIKRHDDAIRKQKEKVKREAADRQERESKFKEMDEASQTRQDMMHKGWEAESVAKLKAMNDHMERVQGNIDRNDLEREINSERILVALARKEQQVEAKQEMWKSGSTREVMVEKIRQAERRRQEVVRIQQDRGKQLLLEHKKQMVDTERKAEERKEKQVEVKREQEKKEKEGKKRIAEIQKKKREILKERADKVLEHMADVDEKQAAYKVRQQQENSLKSEVDRLKHHQVQEKMLRDRQRQEAKVKDLDAALEEKAYSNIVRVQVLGDVVKQRQVHQTQIRLKKEELKEEMFKIKVKNQWNRATQLLREIDPA
mmetsp:Transcript_29853/g.71005  ORF Transcript_29853/g.71005 Transcript_29853/m.71005 type:complete len:506 (+) Transcript_29853:230-1747(+)|eukprot:CAMPEP_0180146164 /NCGR_PEP_ID=MMETSP0986-20121125/18263_1 /TAXON_ID=697907 /ORGANISM="non described non described, Strain CCMP2293" /LENGTH=505 /DNA_ID=CAMNT_0022091001 /DNA_START=115 /DNA_END=1632 /DNA_ORIENTATION=-